MTGTKTFNLYCDESCHLEKDGKRFMLIGYINSAYPQVRMHSKAIAELKEKHHFFGEIKWSNVSRSQIGFYSDLIDYFFSTDLLFRAIVVPKHQVDNAKHQQDFDTFYFKMYYQLLHHKMDMQFNYNVYIDIKDTLSARKIKKLREILNIEFGSIRNLQSIRSHESLLMQLADVIMGALSYNLNDEKKVMLAKVRLIDRIKSHSNHTLLHSTPKDHEKFNLFFIDLK